jgi:hypothetical protein
VIRDRQLVLPVTSDDPTLIPIRAGRVWQHEHDRRANRGLIRHLARPLALGEPHPEIGRDDVWIERRAGAAALALGIAGRVPIPHLSAAASAAGKRRHTNRSTVPKHGAQKSAVPVWREHARITARRQRA